MLSRLELTTAQRTVYKGGFSIRLLGRIWIDSQLVLLELLPISRTTNPLTRTRSCVDMNLKERFYIPLLLGSSK